MTKLVLASASPRRRELLSLITKNFEVCSTDIDETIFKDRPLADEAIRLSERKASAAMERYPNAVCIGSDTIVAIDGMALGKPADALEAEQMLRRLRGREHCVLTSLAVLMPNGKKESLCTKTAVRFRDFHEEDLKRYLITGESLDKAGAYGIQGHGALLIDSINGDYYSVMGLPIARLNKILREWNIV